MILLVRVHAMIYDLSRSYSTFFEKIKMILNIAKNLKEKYSKIMIHMKNYIVLIEHYYIHIINH